MQTEPISKITNEKKDKALDDSYFHSMYSKASRYTASSCTDLAGAHFWIGSKKIWDERIYVVKTLSSTVFWSSCFHPIK